MGSFYHFGFLFLQSFSGVVVIVQLSKIEGFNFNAVIILLLPSLCIVGSKSNTFSISIFSEN